MNQKTEQERMNNIHSGWEKYKELNPDAPISPEFDAMIEKSMMEANGIKEPLTESEKNNAQVELTANVYRHMQLKKMGDQIDREEQISREKAAASAKRRKFRFYVKATLLVAGVGTAILFRDEIGGAVKDVVTKVVELDNKNFEDEYNAYSSEVEELTGMTTSEIMEKGRNIH